MRWKRLSVPFRLGAHLAKGLIRAHRHNRLHPSLINNEVYHPEPHKFIGKLNTAHFLFCSIPEKISPVAMQKLSILLNFQEKLFIKFFFGFSFC
jgi:hypothetical protein